MMSNPESSYLYPIILHFIEKSSEFTSLTPKKSVSIKEIRMLIFESLDLGFHTDNFENCLG